MINAEIIKRTFEAYTSCDTCSVIRIILHAHFHHKGGIWSPKVRFN